MVTNARAQSVASMPSNSSCSASILAFNVGVIGHRPPKLADDRVPAIQDAVGKVLQHIAFTAEHIFQSELAQSRDSGGFCCYSGTKPVLRILSSLAEGADRLVAHEAIALGYKLQIVLPASRDTYGADFKEQQSKSEYDDLLRHANTIFELGGSREEEWLESSAYATAGRLTLAHSDLLLAIWNGEKGEPGGTEEMIQEARRMSLPTLVIYTSEPLRTEFFLGSVSPPGDWRQALTKTVEETLKPPPTAPHGLSGFLSKGPAVRSSPSIAEQLEYADQVASDAAEKYRRTYKMLYLFAPAAVIFAVLGLLVEAGKIRGIPEWFCSAAELLCILTILSLTFLARYRQWHNRWLDARVIAEVLRTWAFLDPLGQSPSIGRQPPYVSLEAAHRDWTGWYIRARIREHGLCSGRMSADFFARYRKELSEAISAQIEHHRRKGGARHRTHRRAEVASFAVFAITGIACLAHLWPHLVSHLWPSASVGSLKPGLITLAAALTASFPAIGSALEGLQAQAEYQRLAERAEGMQDRLKHLHSKLNAGAEQHPPISLGYPELVHTAQEASEVMINESSDWRNLVRIRVLHPV